MLGIEPFSSLAIEARHLQFVDHEATCLNFVNDLTHLSVAVWLDHGEGSLASLLEVSSGCNITVVHDLQDSREDRYLSVQEEVIKLNRRDLLFLKEDARVLDIPHLERFEDGEINDAVGSDDISLLVVPLDLKSILLLA